MSKEQIISPVSIDLGAKNTGVYFAHYPAGSSIEDIEKDGKVYQLEKDSYTLLMAERTARRHQRRGYDRRQMVKRLFKLIWEKHFGLEWDKTVQQATSFLFNRRGFSFLTEEYDPRILSRFPEAAYQLLPNELKIDANDTGQYDFAIQIQEWAREDENKVKEVFDAINKKPKHVAERLVFIGRTEKLKELPTVQAHLGDFEFQLENLKSGKGKPYFSEDVGGNLKKDSGLRTHKDLDARILQFIFDRVKADDPLNLNEIYSHAKKYRQQRSTEQEKAFRHALFLVGHSLREKVINAIDNRTRAVVNGTQRYFAQVLADNLYKKAKVGSKQELLSFDYFGVEAQDNTRGDGIHDLRAAYEKTDHEVFKYAKHEGEKQPAYSHLLDAQLAFAIVANAHKNDGGLKLKIDNSYNLWPVDKGTGEILDKTVLDTIRVKPADAREKNLERNKPAQTSFAHRSIHRDGIYAERYLPILVHKKTSEVRIGFDWNNSYEFKDIESNRRKLYFALRFNRQGINLQLTKDNSLDQLKEHLSIAGFNSKTKYFYISLSVQAIHSYYVKNYNTSKGYQQYSDEMKFLRSLSYRTEKKKITTLIEAEKVLEDQKNFQVGKPKLTLPVKKAWERLVDEWKKSTLADDAFLKKFFREPESKQPHQKVRKVFSLPVKTGEGKILLMRNGWNGRDTFQIVNDSDSRKVDTKAFIPVFVNSKGKIGRLLSESAKSDRVFLLSEDKNEQYYYRTDDDIKVIDPKAWYCITLNDELPKWGIKKLEFCIDNNTRPQVRLTLNNKPKPDEIEEIVDHPLLKPKEKEKLRIRLQEGTEENTIIEYTGSGFQQGIYDKLLPALETYYR